MSSHVADFNARNKSLTAKLLQQSYRYHKLRKTFSKFYRRHYELVSKFNVVHQSFVTTAPPPHLRGFAGDSRANVWGSDFLSSLAVPRKCRACDIMQIYPRGIYDYKEQVMSLSRSPQCKAYSRAVMDEKSLSPIFPVGGVQWVQMTGALD